MPLVRFNVSQSLKKLNLISISTAFLNTKVCVYKPQLCYCRTSTKRGKKCYIRQSVTHSNAYNLVFDFVFLVCKQGLTSLFFLFLFQKVAQKLSLNHNVYWERKTVFGFHPWWWSKKIWNLVHLCAGKHQT